MLHLNRVRVKRGKKGVRAWRRMWVEANGCSPVDEGDLKLRRGGKQSAGKTALPLVSVRASGMLTCVAAGLQESSVRIRSHG